MKLLPVLILFLSIGLAGCEESPDRTVEGLQKPATQTGPPPLTDRQLAEGSGSTTDDHPPITGQEKNVFREIIVPKSVEGKWKAVKILVRDKQDEERNSIQTVELGSTFQLGDSGITVKAGEFFPNFVMDKASYTSMGNGLLNPAIHLVIRDKGKELYDGWTFAKYPGLYAFEHERYSLQLMDFVPVPTTS